MKTMARAGFLQRGQGGFTRQAGFVVDGALEEGRLRECLFGLSLHRRGPVQQADRDDSRRQPPRKSPWTYA